MLRLNRLLGWGRGRFDVDYSYFYCCNTVLAYAKTYLAYVMFRGQEVIILMKSPYFNCCIFNSIFKWALIKMLGKVAINDTETEMFIAYLLRRNIFVSFVEI